MPTRIGQQYVLPIGGRRRNECAGMLIGHYVKMVAVQALDSIGDRPISAKSEDQNLDFESLSWRKTHTGIINTESAHSAQVQEAG